MNWKEVCQPQDQGGLGVVDLKVMNICLLSTWLWKLENEEGLWQELIRNKYLSNVTLSQCKLKPIHSHFWYGLIKIKAAFFSFCRKKIGNGQRTTPSLSV